MAPSKLFDQSEETILTPAQEANLQELDALCYHTFMSLFNGYLEEAEEVTQLATMEQVRLAQRKVQMAALRQKATLSIQAKERAHQEISRSKIPTSSFPDWHPPLLRSNFVLPAWTPPMSTKSRALIPVWYPHGPFKTEITAPVWHPPKEDRPDSFRKGVFYVKKIEQEEKRKMKKKPIRDSFKKPVSERGGKRKADTVQPPVNNPSLRSGIPVKKILKQMRGEDNQEDKMVDELLTLVKAGPSTSPAAGVPQDTSPQGIRRRYDQNGNIICGTNWISYFTPKNPDEANEALEKYRRRYQ